MEAQLQHNTAIPLHKKQALYDALFEKHNACVLIPTYNNASVLGDVLHSVLEYSSSVFVVNDGSTDSTLEVLKGFPQIKVITYARNQGKGWALRTGIKETAKAGFDYMIVMDSDGQHYAKDLDTFLHKLDELPGALLIGARNLNQEHVPMKSSFGNRFSNFWFWAETGIKLPDTQSGYRLYPVQKLAGKKYFTKKYEFEIEVIVRASWSGIPVTYVPVSVYYPPAEERITHFRPFKDFFRISVLNTFLVLIALFWIFPRNLIRLMFSKGGWKKIADAVIQPGETNIQKAKSLGFGVFMGIVPIWGFQLAAGIPLAAALRLNQALFLIAANISVFPITPFWWMASLAFGKILMGNNEWSLEWRSLTIERVTEEGLAFFLGGTVLALALGALTFLLSYLLLSVTRKNK